MYLVHGLNQVVNESLTVTSITTFNIVKELTFSPHVVRVGELEGPEEVRSLLEVRTDSRDFVNKIFNTDDVVLAERLFNNRVISDGDTLLVNLSISTLVDQTTNGLQVRVTVGNIRLNQLKHLRGSLVKTNKDTIVDLQKTQKLKNLTRLGSNVVNTTDTNNKDKLLLGRNVVVTLSLSLTTKTDLVLSGSLVFRIILGSTLEKFASLGKLSLQIRFII
jgi:2-succinyl-5-enolpyruvyl-6-hydroxy-3-cyclohexene-1-carboxylate synthase